MIGADKLKQRREGTGFYNLTCPICGKPFHRKPSRLKNDGGYGLTCSRECSREIRKVSMRGERNHQFGLKGSKNATFINGTIERRNNSLVEKMVYIGEWYLGPSVNGRIPEHKYMVEKHYKHFGDDKFDKIDGWHYLKQGLVIHHIDHNHSNNTLENLCVITKSEHTRLHNLINPRPRNNIGQFIK